MNWFVGGDRRAYFTVDFPKKQGLSLRCYGVPGWEDETPGEHISLLLLPFPAFTGAGNMDALLTRIDSRTLVCGGGLGAYREALEKTGACIRDLYDREPLTTMNAVATVEGALALLIQKGETTLFGSSCLVMGYGRIGSLLSDRLQSMGAKVTVAARSEKARAMIQGRNMIPEDTEVFHRGLGHYDYVINTVPALVLQEEHLKALGKDCVLLDLASAPGGFSQENCRELGLQWIQGSGLPGRFSPKTAGIFYGESLLQVLKKEGRI